MSTNCIRCVKNPRTGADLLCDECRGEASHDTTADSSELARKAINHVLKQIRNNPNVRYHMGAFTESFELLKAAHSAMNGISEDAIEKDTFVALSRKSDSEKIVKIRDMVDSVETRPSSYGAVIAEIGTICRS